LALVLSSPAAAAPVTYFGLDASKQDLTNANAARSDFVATLDSFVVETMESLSGQTDPTVFAGTPFHAATDFDQVFGVFAFSVSGNNALLDQGPPSAEGPGFDDWVQFSQPITAFGSYFAQGGDGLANNLTLRLENTTLGTSKDVSLTLGPGAPFLNIFFFGVTDTDPFDRVTMIETVDYDGMLLDDMVTGFVAPLPTVSNWNVDADGNWNAAANWTSGVPNGAGAAAGFLSAITAPRTVNVDGPIAVGSLTFDNERSYSIGGSGPLSIDSDQPATIDVKNGSHTISATLSIAAGETVTKSGPGTLTISGTQTHGAGGVLIASAGVINLDSDAGANLSLQANSTVRLGASQHLAALQIGTGATVQMTDGTSKTLTTPTLSIAGTPAAPTGKLDLHIGALIINYTGDSPAAEVRQQIIAGRGGGGLGKGWDGQGITSSAAAAADPESRSVGYAENSALPLGPYTNFRGQTVDDTTVLIAFTRTGDANLDGVVNDDDVTIVGAAYAPGMPQPSWALGDFDYNGFVDDDDVTLLGAFYDPSASPPAASVSAAAAVPEPATATSLGAMLAACAIAAVRRRARRHFRKRPQFSIATAGFAGPVVS
jgi:hypothetical protein